MVVVSSSSGLMRILDLKIIHLVAGVGHFEEELVVEGPLDEVAEAMVDGVARALPEERGSVANADKRVSKFSHHSHHKHEGE